MIWLCILLGRCLSLILSALTRFNRAIKGKVLPNFRSVNDAAMALDMIKIELLRLELLRPDILSNWNTLLRRKIFIQKKVFIRPANLIFEKD